MPHSDDYVMSRLDEELTTEDFLKLALQSRQFSNCAQVSIILRSHQTFKKCFSLFGKNKCLPSSFEGWLWHICCRDHLLSWPHPHDRPIITLGPTLESEAGKCTPGQSHLEVRWRNNIKKNLFLTIYKLTSLLPPTKRKL